jgi:hypothetical protein
MPTIFEDTKQALKAKEEEVLIKSIKKDLSYLIIIIIAIIIISIAYYWK